MSAPLKTPAQQNDLRDQFALAAMQAYCSCPVWREVTNQTETAESAYRMADIMLKARAK